MLAQIHPRLPTVVERSAAWLARRGRSAAAFAFVFVAAAIACVAFGRMEGDVPLYDADLHPSQTVEIAGVLTLWGEPFAENAAATQVLVPATRRRDVLLRLTMAGLPHRYVPTTADVLEDKPDILTPQSLIDDRRRSGIEGDLVAGLRRIAGVADASVVLPTMDDDAFGDDASRSPPSASVQLLLQSGAQLSQQSIAGVKRFVASAFPGLDPDRVTVVDGSGAAIGATPPPDPAESKERRVQIAVQSALDDVLGAGAAVVRVSVRTTGVERQMQSTRTTPHGLLSADVGTEQGTDASRRFVKQHAVRKYAYDTVSERRTTAADAQASISVAVFLDARRVATEDDAAISALVRAAAGADLAAGDAVVVQAVPFAPQASAPPALAAPAPVVDRAFLPAAVTCAVILYGFASMPREKRVMAPSACDRAETPALRPLDPAAAGTVASIAGESPQAAAYVIRRLPQRLRDDVLDAIDAERRTAIVSYLEDARDAATRV